MTNVHDTREHARRRPITDETLEVMADKAERGYDVEEHISVSEAIRRAIGQYIRAS